VTLDKIQIPHMSHLTLELDELRLVFVIKKFPIRIPFEYMQEHVLEVGAIKSQKQL
jgi:hypothetical protein